jgi:hypothetical protein
MKTPFEVRDSVRLPFAVASTHKGECRAILGGKWSVFRALFHRANPLAVTMRLADSQCELLSDLGAKVRSDFAHFAQISALASFAE